MFPRARIILVAIGVFTISCSHPQSPSLDGRWVGSYAMFPAIFTFHGDSVAVTLAGKFAEERFEHADSNNNTLIHVIRPNIWMKLIFHGDDSATVVLNPREKIEIARQKY